MTKSVQSNSSNKQKSAAPSKKFIEFKDIKSEQLVYVFAVITSLAVFLDYNRGEASIVEASYMKVRGFLLELGYNGFIATIQQALDFES